MKVIRIEESILARLKRAKDEMKPRDGRGFVSISEAISRVLDVYEQIKRD